MGSKEEKGGRSFTLEDGPAQGGEYGIRLARKSGLPGEVIEGAASIVEAAKEEQDASLLALPSCAGAKEPSEAEALAAELLSLSADPSVAIEADAYSRQFASSSLAALQRRALSLTHSSSSVSAPCF